jgi:hypothetical protein
MVRFEYQPWKKIIIHEIVEYPLEYFINNSTIGIKKGSIGRPIIWSNGLIFISTTFQPTEDVIKEQLQGIIHFTSLHYCKMPEYQREITATNRIRVPLRNLSHHAVFGPMAEWIKQTFIK